MASLQEVSVASIGMSAEPEPETRVTGDVQVVVTDPLKGLRRGLASALQSAGFLFVEICDIESWLNSVRDRAMIVTVLSEEDLTLIEHICRSSTDCPVLALLANNELEEYRLAFLAGATGAIDRGADPKAIVACLEAACLGKSLLPAEVVRQQFAWSRAGHAHEPLLEFEVFWLSSLANGKSVAEVAKTAAYSERAMYRRLSELYRKMGATTRTGALLAAREWGLL